MLRSRLLSIAATTLGLALLASPGQAQPYPDARPPYRPPYHHHRRPPPPPPRHYHRPVYRAPYQQPR